MDRDKEARSGSEVKIEVEEEAFFEVDIGQLDATSIVAALDAIFLLGLHCGPTCGISKSVAELKHQSVYYRIEVCGMGGDACQHVFGVFFLMSHLALFLKIFGDVFYCLKLPPRNSI